MRCRLLSLMAGFLWLVVATSPAGGEDFPTGKWTGTYALSGEGEAFVVRYLIKEKASDDQQAGYRITLYIHDAPFVCTNVQVAEGQISFSMDPGEPVDCLLKAEVPGVYKGQCIPSNGDSGDRYILLVMRQPEQENSAE